MDPFIYIDSFAKFGSRGGYKPGLERIDALLEAFDHPENKVKIIHVAGSNGKGSTITFLKNIYREAGYRVGTYTSPHLARFNERMEINGEKITDEELKKLVEIVQPVVEKIKNKGLGEPSFFELVTTLAFIYFYQKKVDFLILETGLGGRLDASNIVKTPLVSIITGISLEHTSILGESIKEIAREKAGIIKKEVPVATAVQDKDALEEIEKISIEKGCKLSKIREKYTYILKESTLKGQRFYLKHRERGFEDNVEEQGKHLVPEKEYRIKMIGEFQVGNALLAMEVVNILQSEFPVEGKAVEKGLLQAYLPGRMDLIRKNPLILVDGAHNSEGMDIFVSSFLKLKEEENLYKYNPKIYVVFAILGDKDVDNMLKILSRLGNFELIISENRNNRALSVKKIKEIADLIGLKNRIIIPLDQAIKKTLEKAGDDDFICIIGSLYNVAEVINFMDKRTDVL